MKVVEPNYETVATVEALFEALKPSRSIPYKPNREIDILNQPDPIIYQNRQNERKEENWKLKLTIPEPFKMTLRDDNRDSDEKLKICKRVERDVEKNKERDEAECRKIFRANPIPPTTFFPIYADMIRQDEIRRKMRKQQCRTMTLAQQNPFNFYYREEVNKIFHSKSMPNLVQDLSLKHHSSSLINKKQRKRINTAITKPTDHNCSKQNEPNEPTSLQGLNWFVKWSLNQNKSQPKRKLDPPNFTKIHSRLEKKAQNNLPIKVTTTCEPFIFRTKSASSLHKVKKDIKKDEEKLKENRWPFMAHRTPFTSSTNDRKIIHTPSSAPKLNLAAKLRVENSNKQRLIKNEEENVNSVWRNILQRCVKEKISAENDNEANVERLKRKKAKIHSQLVNYQLELNEIIQRVADRPLLMEQQSKMAARKRAEKIFLEKLHANGLSEEFVRNKCASSPSLL